MCGPETLSVWIPPIPVGTYAPGLCAYASREAYTLGLAPLARILMRFPIATAWGARKAFQVRAITPDGRYWHGRSSGGGPVVVLRPVKDGTPLDRYLREYHHAR